MPDTNAVIKPVSICRSQPLRKIAHPVGKAPHMTEGCDAGAQRRSASSSRNPGTNSGACAVVTHTSVPTMRGADEGRRGDAGRDRGVDRSTAVRPMTRDAGGFEYFTTGSAGRRRLLRCREGDAPAGHEDEKREPLHTMTDTPRRLRACNLRAVVLVTKFSRALGVFSSAGSSCVAVKRARSLTSRGSAIAL
jgi:hypothetical protein